MIRTKSIEDQLRQGRLDAKTLDSMFQRRIEEGANCSPFVSKAILAAVKEVYPIGADESDHQLGLGQIQLLVVSAEEPPARRSSYVRKSPSGLLSMPVRRIFKFVWPTASRACADAASFA